MTEEEKLSIGHQMTAVLQRYHQREPQRGICEHALRAEWTEKQPELAAIYDLDITWYKSHPLAPKVTPVVRLHERSAVDRLAEIGLNVAQAALERGLEDGRRLLAGEVSADQLAEELKEWPL